MRSCASTPGSETWPNQWEFIEWGSMERAAALRAGAPDPRIPTAPALARVFEPTHERSRSPSAAMLHRSILGSEGASNTTEAGEDR
jgi:hypothetical protein